MKKKLYGNKPHPETARSLTNVGAAYIGLKEQTKAVSCFEEALTMQKTLYGENAHPSTAKTLVDLGTLFQLMENHQKAAEHYKKSLKMYMQLLRGKA